MPENARSRFLEKLRASLIEETFVKLTLSRRRNEGDLRNVYARLIVLKAGPHFSMTLRHARRDETRNIPPLEAPAQIGSMLADVFEEAHLFTTTGDWKLRADSHGQGTLKAARPTFIVAEAKPHDRPKARILTHAPFLIKLGVTHADGAARAGMADKLRQIERFAEMLGHLLDATTNLPQQPAVCDLGSGKGYLTFAAHTLMQQRGLDPRTTGIELRPELVELCNRTASECALSNLSFYCGAIAEVQAHADVVIALHACDTATDDALAYAIRSGAEIIVTSPCCHKEARAQMVPPPLLAEVLRHGILAERQSELITDGLRALLLESAGYEARVFEFISTEHTGKNLMIAAIRRHAPDVAKLFRAREIMDAFGLQAQRLYTVLASTQ